MGVVPFIKTKIKILTAGLLGWWPTCFSLVGCLLFTQVSISHPTPLLLLDTQVTLAKCL